MYKRVVFFICFGIHLFGEEAVQPKYNLSICAVFKNEAKFLKEWLEFHQLVGVEHFYLYNVESNDSYWKILRPFMEKGVVSLHQWPNVSGESNQAEVVWALGTQLPAYENVIKLFASTETKWLVFVDTDEFLIPCATENLADVLHMYPEACGIVLSADYFDASIKSRFSSNQLILESIHRTKAPRKMPRTPVEKVIFKPALCEAFFWPPYTCLFKDDKQPVKIGREDIRINHYINREVVPRHSEKIRNKGYSENGLNLRLESTYLGEDREKTALRFLPDIREKMGF